MSGRVMLDEVARYALSFGISGLLFVMWWYERKERAQHAVELVQSQENGRRVAELNGRLLDVIQANTEALVALREELRWQRQSEPEWAERLVQRIEELCEKQAPRPRFGVR
jgi:hypothetical protein